MWNGTYVLAAITFGLNCSVLQVDKAPCLGFRSKMSTADWVWDIVYMVYKEPLGLIGE